MELPLQFNTLRSSHGRLGRSSLALFAVLFAGCQGEIGGRGAGTGASPKGGAQSPGNGPNGGSGTPGGSSSPGGSSPGGDGTSSAAPDVNRVAIHRLNNAEYDNTMHDLLGVTSAPGKDFIEDEKLYGFDDIASAFGMTDAQYEQYFNAADALVEEAFASDSLRKNVMTCTTSDATCTKKIISGFGSRAWRRPLEQTEVDRLAQVATDATTAGEDFTGSIKQVIKTMLSSVDFLYRVEKDDDPASSAPHPVGSYEMASRLSYLFWSTMPDGELLDRAAKGDLTNTDVLSTQVDRLLGDARAAEFTASFAGQWLGLRDLGSHQVDTTVFPAWNDGLRSSMVQEGLSYFDEFLSGTRGMKDFFTADVNFVDGPLANLYGITGQTGSDLKRVTNTTDTRRGFVGLASFLTMTSYSYRTAPTLRGKWVLENLLCQDIPPPPANVPKLDSATAAPDALQSENVRQRLEAHRADPTCASCHKILDPIGLGLENFDAIGKYRTKYANGDTIDASGVLPDGTMFVGLNQLTDALAKDPRLTDCASEKMMTYALSRQIVASDGGYLEKIRTEWANDGMGLASLLKQIVLSEPFRNRRGEPE